MKKKKVTKNLASVLEATVSDLESDIVGIGVQIEKLAAQREETERRLDAAKLLMSGTKRRGRAKGAVSKKKTTASKGKVAKKRGRPAKKTSAAAAPAGVPARASKKKAGRKAKAATAGKAKKVGRKAKTTATPKPKKVGAKKVSRKREGSSSSSGFRDAVRSVLEKSGVAMKPAAVRDALKEAGVASPGKTDYGIRISNELNRMAKSGQVTKLGPGLYKVAN